MNETPKPCEFIVYLHHMLGGALDGQVHPSEHRYETYRYRDFQTGRTVEYADTGEPALECEPGNLRVMNLADEFREPVFRRVNMKPSRRPAPAGREGG